MTERVPTARMRFDRSPLERTKVRAPVHGLTLFLFLIALIAFGPELFAQSPIAPTNRPGATVVIEVEGKALLARSGSEDWKPSRIGDELSPGDRFRTLERSRAVIRLSDLSLLRLGELSHIQMPAASERRGGLQFLRGILYYFHRDRPGVMPVSTPSAHAVVLGTEFVLQVDDTSTRLSMIDGLTAFTNEVGRIDLTNGQTALANVGRAPAMVPALKPATTLQWILYYPGALDLAELELSPDVTTALRASVDAYRQGDLVQSLADYPADRAATESSEQLFRASLFLAVGRVEPAEAILDGLRSAPTPVSEKAARLAAALNRLVVLVRSGAPLPAPEPTTATEWLVESFVRQARSDLNGARVAARTAIGLSPEFAFAWAQLAELEFSFGRAAAARVAAQRSLALAPRHARALALQGFTYAAEGRVALARETFNRAIEINGAMGDAWLGRGLCRIRLGDLHGGRDDLQTAVTVEPQRAILRSYLAKAWDESDDVAHARQELGLARELDPADPTAWLYSAILHQQQNEINQGVADLEQAAALNDNRSLFRSRQLLDQDQAVAGANLAALYRDAGLAEVGALAAARATSRDYANPSAHLFLANSYNTLRDPNLAQLRYETPTVSEYLVANLLAPVGVTRLSPMISQQEYSPLFDRNRIGIASETGYTSDGGWFQSGSHYGVLDRVGYALDATWRSTPGHRPNTDLEQFVGSGQFKIQLSPDTSVYALASYATVDAGDVRSYYDERDASRTLRLQERQEPTVIAGLHHRWSPGVHTLFLAARLNDTVEATVSSASIRTLVRDGGGALTGVLNPADSLFGLQYRSVLNAWSAELQQIVETPRHLWLAGGRVQTGELETRSILARDPFAFPPVFTDPAARQRYNDPLDRANAYAYGHWQILESLRLMGGLSYEWLRYPRNFDAPPIENGVEERDQLSPKAGLEWTPATNLHVRGAYTRSLGGVTYDSSVRLEPTQLAGFIQAYRSLVPESRSGLVPGTAFETFHLGLDYKFPTRTYVVLESELLRSDGQRSVGVFDYTDAPPFLAVPSSLRQHLDFEERTVALSLHQLLSDEWAASVRYRLTDSELDSVLRGLPDSIDPSARVNEAALLHQVDLAVQYQHPVGFFGRAEAHWRRQDNRRDAAVLRDEDIWQFDLWAGWRFARRRVEVAIGVMNIGDQNYRLNPLNSGVALPRERLLATRLRWSF